MVEFAFATCLVIGFLRFTLPVEGKVNKKDIFKDLAHIWVGFLIGMGVGTQSWCPYGCMAATITALEVVAFIVRKKP